MYANHLKFVRCYGQKWFCSTQLICLKFIAWVPSIVGDGDLCFQTHPIPSWVRWDRTGLTAKTPALGSKVHLICVFTHLTTCGSSSSVYSCHRPEKQIIGQLHGVVLGNALYCLLCISAGPWFIGGAKKDTSKPDLLQNESVIWKGFDSFVFFWRFGLLRVVVVSLYNPLWGCISLGQFSLERAELKPELLSLIANNITAQGKMGGACVCR